MAGTNSSPRCSGTCRSGRRSCRARAAAARRGRRAAARAAAGRLAVDGQRRRLEARTSGKPGARSAPGGCRSTPRSARTTSSTANASAPAYTQRTRAGRWQPMTPNGPSATGAHRRRRRNPAAPRPAASSSPIGSRPGARRRTVSSIAPVLPSSVDRLRWAKSVGAVRSFGITTRRSARCQVPLMACSTKPRSIGEGLQVLADVHDPVRRRNEAEVATPPPPTDRCAIVIAINGRRLEHGDVVDPVTSR